jgi:CheY-like chemotaxis protein
MRPQVMTKYAFRIRTRAGLMLNQLMIPGRDRDEAERKLRQIYRDCEVLACTNQAEDERKPVVAYLATYHGMTL